MLNTLFISLQVRNDIRNNWKTITDDELKPYKEMAKKGREENSELRAKGLLIEKEKEKERTKNKKQMVWACLYLCLS